MSDIESDEPDLDAEHGDVSEECHSYLKRKKLRQSLPELINLSKIPNDPESMNFKTEMKSKRLSTRIEKKVTEIKNRFKSLDTSLDHLKKLVNENRTNTDEHIQATMHFTSNIIGEFTKKRMETATNFNKERDKYTEDTARESTEIEKEIQTTEAILAEIKEQHDQKKRAWQEQEAAERSRIESEIQNMKTKEAEEKSRHDREIENLKARVAEEKGRHDREIENSKARVAEEKGRHDREIENLKARVAEEKGRHDREIENSKARVAEEKNRTHREIENLKAKEAEENDRIKGEIKNLNKEVKELEVKIKIMADEEVIAKTNLNKTRETLQTHLKQMTQKKEKIEGIIIWMNAIMNNKKKAMDDCIKALTERLINIKNNMKENFKLMDQIEKKKTGEVNAELQNLRNVENQIIESVENNIQTL